MEKTWTTRKGNQYTISLTREKTNKKELLEGLLGLMVISIVIRYFFLKDRNLKGKSK
ncbi:hypothetical protein J7S27_04970 [Carnobacteriaceae bacterium zg-C25]|nr:hypothetical protein [Carnobacteriaceae bacterium zg-ZUI240]QTU82651.1 hypothetical protein J7S27_04970 [Carnobacteriaceae bacterium zg-C25]